MKPDPMHEAQRCRLFERAADGKPSFKFRRETDVAATFARVRKAMAPPPSNVKPIKAARKA